MAKAKKSAKKPAKKAPAAKAGGVSKNYVDAKFKSLQEKIDELVKRVEELEAKVGAEKKESVEERTAPEGSPEA